MEVKGKRPVDGRHPARLLHDDPHAEVLHVAPGLAHRLFGRAGGAHRGAGLAGAPRVREQR